MHLTERIKGAALLVIAFFSLAGACESGWIDAENRRGANPQLLPVWSQDGSQILFGGSLQAANSGGPLQAIDYIYTVDSDGSHLRRVSAPPPGYGWIVASDEAPPRRISTPPSGDEWYADYSPAVSPDSRRVAYVTYRHDPGFFSLTDRSLEIGVSLLDGSDYRRLTSNEDSDTNPAWSPDGTRIAFVSDRGEGQGWGIYTMANDGSDVQPLTPSSFPVTNDPPIWSPDGRHLAFLTKKDGTIDLYTVRADGSNRMRISPVAFRPAWSADGSRIAFVRPDEGSFWFYTADPDGSHLWRIPRQGQSDIRYIFSNGYLYWSPDGSEIRFLGERYLSKDDEYVVGIFAIMVDGSGIRTLAERVKRRTLIAFSPDGSRIAIRDDVINPAHDNLVLYTVATDGSDAEGLVWEEAGRLVTAETAQKQLTHPEPLVDVEATAYPRPTLTPTPAPPPLGS